MPWIPVLKIGLWNAWMLTLFVILHPLVLNVIDKAIGTGDINRKMGDEPQVEGEKRSIPFPTLLLVALFIYSIFLPLKLGTSWLYFGLAIYMVGVAVFLNALITAARTPKGQIFSGGMYRYSRHPLYLSFMVIFVGISVATTSWLFLFLSIGWMIFPISQVTAEERGCLKTFGFKYQEYVHRTPKWLGIPKPKR